MTRPVSGESSNGSPAEKTVGVLVAHPLPTVLAGLSLALDAQPGLEVVSESTSTDDILDQMKHLQRRNDLVAVISLALKGQRDSFWLIRRIRESFPSVAIVAMGENSEQRVISRALFVGADGFLDQKAELPDFVDGVRQVARGEVAIVGPPPDWLGPITQEVWARHEPVNLLTEREKEVLGLAAEGRTAREIGTELGLRERTITTHLGRIYARLGVHGRIAAIAQGAKLGLIEPREIDLR